MAAVHPRPPGNPGTPACGGPHPWDSPRAAHHTDPGTRPLDAGGIGTDPEAGGAGNQSFLPQGELAAADLSSAEEAIQDGHSLRH